MLCCFAIRLRAVVLHALSMGLVAGFFVTVLSAQTRAGALQPVKQADRVAANPDFGPLTALSERLPGWVRAGNQTVGRTVDLGATMHVSVVLSRDAGAEAAFEQLLAEQQNPGSPRYHQWLTPEQIGQLFGPTQHDLAAVRTWLTSQGLTVDSIAPSGVIVEASGTMAMVGNAFHTSFGSFSVGETSRLSALSTPSIPTALSGLIRSVHGLTEAPLEPMSHAVPMKGAAPFSAGPAGPGGAQPQMTITQGGVSSYFITPNDFAVIYDLKSVYSGGNKGATIGSAAQHVAIVGRSRVAATDISEYATNTGITNYTLNTIIPTTGVDPGPVCTNSTCKTSGDQDEATLDVDRVIGTAPGVTADLVVSANVGDTDGVYIAAAYNVNTLVDPIMTISFGSCEVEDGPSEVEVWDTLFSTAAGEGISVFVSSDDSGAAGCDEAFSAPPATQAKSINAICSSSYATCVGGTEFNDTASPSTYWAATDGAGYESALSYIPEGGWNEPSTTTGGATYYQIAASGGGASAYLAKPSWQTGTGVPADGYRDVPDVAFSAASHDGYYTCLDYATLPSGTCLTGYFAEFSGTSAAAPGMAGIAALLNTKLGSAQGNLNPLLYRLAGSSPEVFHDVTVESSGVQDCTAATPSMCNNSTPGPTSLSGGLAGYGVTAGYDQATGLGSIDGANLMADAVPEGSNNGVGSFTLAANSATVSVTPAANATTTSASTITGTSVSGFVGTVVLSCAISPATSQPPTCSVSPSSLGLGADGTASATLTIASAAASSGCSASVLPGGSPWRGGATGVVLAGFLLLILPVRKRRSMPALALMICVLGAGLGSLSGCSGSTTTTVCAEVASAGTAAGTYTVTVIGTSGSVTANAPVTLTVN